MAHLANRTHKTNLASQKGAPVAVVVGMCAHGLAVARALAKNGVQVHALEANRALPGFVTRYAKVTHARDINGRGLIDALIRLHETLPEDSIPILFLTNDNMVRRVAEYYSSLKDRYRISWSTDCENVVALLGKSAIAQFCQRSGLKHPQTFVVTHLEDLADLLPQLSFPVIVKPDKPLSSFKVAVAKNADELRSIVAARLCDLPLIVQQWISGGDADIFFCALYLNRGHPIASFCGHKLRSRPMGHTTVAEMLDDREVFEKAARFFSTTQISGPVSLELKRGPDGDLWVIEPTVGRTDFWVDCCIANGLDLPYVECCQEAGLELPMRRFSNRYVWFNLDRDPRALLWYLWHCLRSRQKPRRPTFLYIDRHDLQPFIRSLGQNIANLGWRIKARVSRLRWKFAFLVVCGALVMGTWDAS